MILVHVRFTSFDVINNLFELPYVQVMGNVSEFIRAVQLAVENVSFSGPCTTVQVFEATIRYVNWHTQISHKILLRT